MFSHVGINQKHEDTRVKELSNENKVSNSFKLLRVSVFSNPVNQFDNDHLQN
jgi:hypothetical protein